MAIQLPPKKETPAAAPKKAEPKKNEKQIQAVINKGGSVLQTAPAQEEEVYKNFNVKILESELKDVNELRDKRPKVRGQKRAGISLHDWIVEAIQEKIEREKRKLL